MFSCYETFQKEKCDFFFFFFFFGGGSIFHYWIWTRVDRKVTLWSLNFIHKFNPNYLLIKPTKTICFHAMRPSKKKKVIFFLGGGSIFHYWIWTRVDRKVTLWSLNLIHKFNPNYLLIKPTQTICFHTMRPSKYQNNNTESLMGVQTSYMLLDWTILFLIFRKTGRHLFLQCFKFGKAMYIIRNKIRVICSKIRVGMGGGHFP